MEVPLITLDKGEAKERAEDYFSAIKRGIRDPMYEAALKGYKVLAEGKPLIDLHQAIGSSGWDSEGRPRLAIARSDRQEVSFFRARKGLTFCSAADRYTRKRYPELFRNVPLGSMPDDSEWSRWRSASALVPMVPASVRPKGPLKCYYTLFEAEWGEISVDPYLLRHVAGSLYAVIAEWNLTTLEVAVMRGRLDRSDP
jgi:hypothetical protein